jgi:hypothetical protein
LKEENPEAYEAHGRGEEEEGEEGAEGETKPEDGDRGQA